MGLLVGKCNLSGNLQLKGLEIFKIFLQCGKEFSASNCVACVGFEKEGN